MPQRVKASGNTVVATDSFTRPADTTAYAAGDCAADSDSAPTVNAISVARYAGGTGVILSGLLIDSGSPATAGEYEVWLFDTTWTADNDNAAFSPSDAEAATVVAVIPFSSSSSYVGTASGNRVYVSDTVGAAFNCTGTGPEDSGAVTTLYWALVVRNAYTPISEEVFTLRLSVSQD